MKVDEDSSLSNCPQEAVKMIPQRAHFGGCRSWSVFSMKLWWRFRTSNSLWAKFLKSKYLKTSQHVNYEPRWWDSHCWKRMHKVGKEAEKNITWAVGDGEISLWKDNWLRGKTLKEVYPNGEESNEKLNVLLSSEGWQQENVRQRFPTLIANSILDIPTGGQDRAYWIRSSGYKFSTKETWEQIRQKRSTSDLYKLLWHHAIPIKITILTWRAIEGLIPTDLKMRKMGVIGPSRCQCCDQEESMEHIFLTSEKATAVWKHYNMHFGINMMPQSIISMIKSWIYSHDWILRGHVRTWIPQIILWALWKGRNESKHKGKKMQTLSIIYSIEHKIQSIIQTNMLKTKHYRGESSFCKKFSCRQKESKPGKIITFKWERPEGSWMKLNVDGCAKHESGPSAAGGLLRNSKGEIVFSFCSNLGVSSAYLAELHAARLGLRICKQMGMRQVWIEMDSLTIVKQINNKFEGNWQSFEAFKEISVVLSGISWRCTHVWREANAAADLLAMAGLVSPLQEVCLDPKLGAPFAGVVAMEEAGMNYWRKLKCS